MTREEFDKNLFLVNNNALYSKHTEHISTTEPLYVDGMAGSDNVVHEPERKPEQVIAAFGDYLLSDLKTIVANADLTDEQKNDVVGICIGQNPVNGKNVFWNVDTMVNANTYKFYTSDKFDASKFTTKSDGESVTLSGGTNYGMWGVNRDVFGGEPGYIMATAEMSKVDPQGANRLLHFGEFGGLQNTIEWYKQATAGGIDVATEMPALNAIMQLSGVDSLDDNYNGWFLGSMGHITLLCEENMPWGPKKSEQSLANYAAIKAAIEKLGKSYIVGYYWSSSFCLQDQTDSRVHCMYFASLSQFRYNTLNVSSGYRLFALIER